MAGLLDTAISGLRVSQNALRTTGHNIANANTPGYSRQSVETATNPAASTGAGFIGSGVQTTSIQRTVDQFVIEQLRIDSSLEGELSAFNENIRQLDSLLSDPATGLSQSMDAFFAAIQNAADDPTSIPARQLVISESENLVARYNTLYERFDSLNNGVNESLEAAISQVNALAANVAELNNSIAAATSINNIVPNDLLDQRDEALRQLSELVAIQAYDQGDGQLNVIIGGGQSLVVGSTARNLALVNGELNASQMDVAFQDEKGDQVITSFINGGEVGGLLSFRNTSLSETYNELGRVALVMADTFNETHQRGLNLNNQFGGLFFKDVNDDSLVTSRAFGATTNGSPKDAALNVFIRDSGQLSSSDYELRISTINSSYSIVRLSDDTQVASGAIPGVLPASVEFDGIELSFASGTFNSGDRFLIQPTRTGARDIETSIFRPEELAFASPVSTEASLGNTGNGAISAGELLSLEGSSGNALPTFATQGVMDPPLLVRFTSPTTYDVLDNSDPGKPKHLEPPLRNQQYVPGVTQNLFTSDTGETLVVSSGSLLGLGAVPAPLTGNGYPAEDVIFTTTDPQTGLSSSLTVTTGANDSARDIANALSAIPGVSANARNYVEIAGITGGLSSSSEFEITLNSGGLTPVTIRVDNVAVSDMTSEGQIYDYIAEQINQSSELQQQGIYAVSGTDTTAVPPVRELRIFSTTGEDISLGFNDLASLPALPILSLELNDEVGNAASLGHAESRVIGGYIDVSLPDGMSMSTNPPNSSIFGDNSDPNFARSTYLGIQASISGIPDVGDNFTIDFNTDGVTDNRNALAIADLSLEKLVDGNRTSYSDSYGALVEKTGIKTNASEINLQASQQILTQTTELRNSVSGVNLDEEAANLIQFEQIYNANAQVISVARDLFDRLINIF